MKRIAVCPGSFDPITIGHEDIIRRMAPLFDELIVAIGFNQQKKYLFPLEKRKEMINTVFADDDKISCEHYEGLTVNYCRKKGADYLIRGLRSSTDFEYEKQIALLNLSIAPVETVLIISRPEYSHISSSIVREIIVNEGNASQFLPESVRELAEI